MKRWVHAHWLEYFAVIKDKWLEEALQNMEYTKGLRQFLNSTIETIKAEMNNLKK